MNRYVKVKVRDTDGKIHVIEARSGENLGKLLASKGLLPLPCGGRGLCGQCIVKVNGNVSPPTGNELARRIGNGLRLACQTLVLGETYVELIYKPILNVSKLTLSVDIKKIDPIYKLIELRRHYPKDEGRIPILMRRELIDEMCRYYVSVFDLVMGCTSDESGLILLIDLGTTKIAYQVIDRRGNVIREGVELNPLVRYGLDIITRLSSALDPRLRYEMKSTLRKKIQDLVKEDLSLIVIAGNSVMESLLLGLPLEQLAVKPFQPYIKGPFIDLEISSKTPAYVMPLIGGFVGGDAYADLALTEYMDLDKPYMIIDIGTNTEIIIVTDRNSDPIYATSAPAGPAFEGHIESGAGIYQPGISRIEIIGTDYEGKPIIRYHVEGRGKPVGLIGSGIISLVAELLRQGFISSNGKIVKGYQRINGIKNIVIVDEAETATGKPILFSQKDLREIQKAIAAIKTGWQILLNKSGISINAIKWVYVTGFFGSSINVEDLLLLGLIPPISKDRIITIGDAVLAGLKVLVLDRDHNEYMREFVSKANVVDLASTPEFTSLWIENLSLGNKFSNSVS